MDAAALGEENTIRPSDLIFITRWSDVAGIGDRSGRGLGSVPKQDGALGIPGGALAVRENALRKKDDALRNRSGALGFASGALGIQSDALALKKFLDACVVLG